MNGTFTKERSDGKMDPQVALLTDLLYETSSALSGLWREVFQEQELSPSALLILREVRKEPGLTVSELARRTGSAKSHVSRLVGGLSRQGYLERHPDPRDHRLLRVSLSPAAGRDLTPLATEVRRRLGTKLSRLPAGEVTGLIAGLRTLMALLREEAISG